MPSYSRTVKDELARIFDDEENCLRAELTAMLKVGAIFSEGRMEFSTVNAAVARKLIKLLNKFYPAAKREIATFRHNGFINRTRYFVRIFLTGVTEKFFAEMDSLEIVPDDFTKVAYLRGAFLASGTVNKPEKQYYLDISATSESAANFLNQIMLELEFNPTFCVRKGFFVNYICEGDAIEEFLEIIGADESLERFQIARNLKDVRVNVNRLVNCETANLNKAVDTSQKQIADINFLLKNNVAVDDAFKTTMDIRLKFPELTIGELAVKISSTRQTLNYRFKKIHELAVKLQENPNAENNLGRTVAAIKKQVADAQFLTKNKISVGQELRHIIRIRLKFPQYTVEQLAEKLSVTVQDLNRHLKKIHNLALKLKKILPVKKS